MPPRDRDAAPSRQGERKLLYLEVCDLPMNRERCLEILDLPGEVSRAEMKQVYRDLVAVWHPDRFAHNPRLQKKAEHKLKEVNLAYQLMLGLPPAPNANAGSLTIPDQRQYRRSSQEIYVDWWSRDLRKKNGVSDAIQNLSATGAFIVTSVALPNGMRLALSFSLPHFGPLFNVAAEVVRFTPLGIGVQFKISPQFRKFIAGFI